MIFLLALKNNKKIGTKLPKNKKITKNQGKTQKKQKKQKKEGACSIIEFE